MEQLLRYLEPVKGNETHLRCARCLGQPTYRFGYPKGQAYRGCKYHLKRRHGIEIQTRPAASPPPAPASTPQGRPNLLLNTSGLAPPPAPASTSQDRPNLLLNTSGLAPLSPPSKKAKAGIIKRLVSTKVDSTSTDAHPQLGGRHVAFSLSPIRPDEGHIARNAYKTPHTRPRAQIKPAHKTNAGTQGPKDAARPSNMAASAGNLVPTSQASTSDTSTSEQKYTVEDHRPTTSTPAGAKGPANLSVRHLFELMDKHSHKTTPAVPTTNVANQNLNYIGYDAGFAHFLDLLNRGSLERRFRRLT
ncbi:uncharacterized protein LOC119765632 [Culex quinquefasciatus]|uniref:uncharacterized protein LOC119765632 n=1 Tax=Culex quinquefasciatus TaxID=7176 RepID=UPI0018E325DF|nr:uncharacterized protein LOC119765632 [Culex quinquefasciatus]